MGFNAICNQHTYKTNTVNILNDVSSLGHSPEADFFPHLKRREFILGIRPMTFNQAALTQYSRANYSSPLEEGVWEPLHPFACCQKQGSDIHRHKRMDLL